MHLQATILADGEPCPKALRQRLCRGRFTIVLDGAAEAVRREGWVPDLIAGDLDSIRPATLGHFSRKGARILHTPDQNHTDLEKALAWCLQEGAQSIWVAQALGGRMDHTFANLSLLKRYFHPGLELKIFQPGECLRFACDEKLLLRGRKGRRLAVLPFPACAVRSRGLAYELRGEKLELGVRESVANHALTAEVRLSIQGEALVVEGMEEK